MASASSPWPQASWKRTPPEPPARTTGARRVGAGRASSLVRAWRAALRRHRRHVLVLEHLEPRGLRDRLVAGLHARVAARHADHVHPRAHEVVAREGAVGARDEDPAARVAEPDHDLADGGARRPRGVVGGLEQLDAPLLRDVAGHDARAHVVGGEVPERDGRRRALAGPRDRRGGPRCLEQPALGQVGRVGEARSTRRRRRGCPRRARGCCPSLRPCAGPSS